MRMWGLKVFDPKLRGDFVILVNECYRDVSPTTT
jgi:hypothetical protein